MDGQVKCYFLGKGKKFSRKHCFELRWKIYRPVNGTRYVIRKGEKVGGENQLLLEF